MFFRGRLLLVDAIEMIQKFCSILNRVIKTLKRD